MQSPIYQFYHYLESTAHCVFFCLFFDGRLYPNLAPVFRQMRIEKPGLLEFLIPGPRGARAWVVASEVA